MKETWKIKEREIQANIGNDADIRRKLAREGSAK